MKNNELLLSSTEVYSDIDLNVSKEDIVNILSVRYEKALRDEKEALTNENQELLAKRNNEDKKIIDEFNEIGSKKLEPLVKKLNEITQSLSKYIRVGHNTGLSITNYKTIDRLFNSNGEPFNNYIFTITGSLIFNNNAFDTITISMPAKIAKYGISRLDINPKIQENTKRISELNKEIGDMAFRTKLMHAKVIEQTLNASEKGIHLLKSLT